MATKMGERDGFTKAIAYKLAFFQGIPPKAIGLRSMGYNLQRLESKQKTMEIR